MEIKVISRRKVSEEEARSGRLQPLLVQLRSMATQQPGYITGQILINIDDPTEYLVISQWKSQEEWDRWVANDERKKIQKTIDGILQEPTTFQIYCNG